MRMLALLTGLTVATVLAGMVPANRTASETSVALADQNGTCVDCAVRQPIKDFEIPQEPRDDGCSGCADRQPTEPTIVAERAEVTPTVEPADGISKCTACATEKPDGLGVPITPALPAVKLTVQTGGCANCVEERSRRKAPQHQSGSGNIKRRKVTYPSRRAAVTPPTAGCGSSRHRVRISRSRWR